MEMEGRGFSDLFRSTTEEILIKSMMDNPIGNPGPSMEMLGFKNIMQPFRADSEELFNSWLMNGEIPASTITHRTRQASMRISADLGSSQQNAISFPKRNGDEYTSHQNFSTGDEHLNDPGQYSIRNSGEDGIQANGLYLAKAWLPQPLTRNKSSELRRKYACMQSSQVTVAPQAQHNMPTLGTDRFKQDFTNMSNFFNIPIAEMPNQLRTFMPPSNSSTAFSPSIATADTVSSVVSMLNGTLVGKEIDSKVYKETCEGCSYGMLTSQGTACSISSIQGTGNQATVFHMLSPVQVPSSGNMAIIEKPLELSMKGFPAEANHIQMSTISQEPSRSESTTAAPALSAGFEVCDGTAQSGPTNTTCGNYGKHVGNGSSELEPKDKESRERMFENSLKNSRKKESLARMDSISSGTSADKADPTKKRRVERSRKMAEAKERNSTPSLPSDMHGILKRCENLEKEVRSLKLNLSFMNRKDSEQTRQMEELQKQNEELTEEKERLLAERERIISQSCKF